MRKVNRIVCGLAILLILMTGGAVWMFFSGNADALRDIVLTQCVPNEQLHQRAAPCAEVNLKSGYVLFKDRNGPLQYLLMPTWRVNGIESPLLLNPQTPNYFWLAWQNRQVMSERRGAPVSDSAVSLVLNSRLGRSQNHFHIHISCLRQDVRKKLDQVASGVGMRWSSLPGGLQGHNYLVRQVTEAELAKTSPFLMLAEEVPQAREHMGRFSLAVVQKSSGTFLLLATERDGLTLNLGSAEEIQDHQCDILQ